MKFIITLITLAAMLLFSGACAQSESKSEISGVKLKMKYKDISAEEFKKKMENDNVVILDVRTDSEVAEGMIEGAIQIDINGSDFDSKIAALDKNKEYIIYCRSGGRSGRQVPVRGRL